MNQRPTGVTVLAILAFVGGILSILAALTLLGLGGLLAGAGFGGLAVFFGIYALVWGALALWIGWGFWQLRPSAWRWGIILMVVGAVITLIQIPLGYSSGGIASAAISIAIDLAVIYYLTTPAVRAAFGQSTSGGMMDAVMGAFGMGGGGAASMPTPPAMGEPPAMTPPPEPPAMTPPAGSTWSGSPGSTGGESDAGGEDENR